jgi:MFS family permease
MLDQFMWSSALLSGAYSLSVVVDGTVGILAGRFTDKLGPRKVLIFGGLLGGIGLILVSQVTAIWQMYILYGILVGTGLSAVFVPVVTNLPRWFIARRNTMSGVVLAGMGVGTLAMSPVIYWLITKYGWQTSYIFLGVFFLVIVVAAAQFMKLDPSQVGQVPYNKPSSGKQAYLPEVRNYTLSEAVRTRQMWMIFAMYFCFGYSGLSLMVHLVPHIIDIDISPAVAASVMAVMGGVNILGRLAFGAIGDRFGTLKTYLLGLATIGALLIWLLFIRDIWMLYIFGCLWGFASGGANSVQTPIVAEFFGVKSIGALFGVCGLGTMVGGSIGPVLVGWLFDVKGDYQIAFITCIALAVIGIGINLILIRSKNRAAALSLDNRPPEAL